MSEKKVNSILSFIVIILFMLTIVVIYLKHDSITSVSKLLPITSIETDKKVVAIACNVYEGKEELKNMIRVLNKDQIKISFFIGGVWAYNNPDTLLMLKNDGQDIQNHGYNHRLASTLNKQNNIREIKDTEKLIYNITHHKTTLFEPPSGDYDDNALSLVNELRYKAVTWSVDTIDWREDATTSLILSRIEKKLHPGAIILIHPKAVTAKAFPDIIKLINDRGYKIVTVKRLIEMED